MSSKSTFSNSTSRSYALALYELSKEDSELEKVEESMKALQKLLKESSNFKEIIESPAVSKEEKKNVIIEIGNIIWLLIMAIEIPYKTYLNYLNLS